MANLPHESRTLRDRVLQKARELAEEVREISVRVHQEALESHRLIEIARRQSERGRDLSRAGHQEVDSVRTSIKWSLDAAAEAERRLARKNKD